MKKIDPPQYILDYVSQIAVLYLKYVDHHGNTLTDTWKEKIVNLSKKYFIILKEFDYHPNWVQDVTNNTYLYNDDETG